MPCLSGVFCSSTKSELDDWKNTVGALCLAGIERQARVAPKAPPVASAGTPPRQPGEYAFAKTSLCA